MHLHVLFSANSKPLITAITANKPLQLPRSQAAINETLAAGYPTFLGASNYQDSQIEMAAVRLFRIPALRYEVGSCGLITIIEKHPPFYHRVHCVLVSCDQHHQHGHFIYLAPPRNAHARPICYRLSTPFDTQSVWRCFRLGDVICPCPGGVLTHAILALI